MNQFAMQFLNLHIYILYVMKGKASSDAAWGIGHQIYVIGSPDIDIMLSNHLPTFEEAKERYEIPFEKYGILMYHPVTTEYEIIGKHVEELVNAVKESGRNYIVIYPNNDLGSEVILNAYRTLADETRYRLYPSTRFEYFLTLLKMQIL